MPLPFPDRLSALMARIESGETVTQTDVDRLAKLQALDLARAGEEFARQAIAREAALTEAFRKVAESG